MLDERTEAILAAYIDGQLPPAERAQVEQYLATHPNQARSIEQMLQARRWMASLPRAKAPPELLDAIDPALERSALLVEPEEQHTPLLRRILAPQVLALAAALALVITLVAAMIWLAPGQAGTQLANEPVEGARATTRPAGGPGSGVPTRGNGRIIRNNSGVNGSEIGRLPDGPSQGTAMAGGGTVDSVPDDPENGGEGVVGVRNDQVQTPTGIPERSPRVPRDALLVAANVPDVRDASGRLTQVLLDRDLPLDAQISTVGVLPPAIRDQLELPAEQRVMVYVLEDVSLAEVGDITAELSRVGTSRVVTPRWEKPVTQADQALARPRQAHLVDDDFGEMTPEKLRERQLKEQARKIHAEDKLTISIRRTDDGGGEPPLGMPKIPEQLTVDVEVSPEGYVDLGVVGLGRVDVLGREPQFLADLVKEQLASDFLIPTMVAAGHKHRANPRDGRTEESIKLVNLEREPLKSGDLLQLTYPDASWLQAVVEEDGHVYLGDLGQVAAAGKSTMAVQAELRERFQGHEAPGATTIPAKPLRLANLTARRALNIDTQAEKRAPAVVVLHGKLLPGAGQAPTTRSDPWAPIDGNGATQPASQPAGPDAL